MIRIGTAMLGIPESRLIPGGHPGSSISSRDPNRRVIHDRGSCDPGGAVEATSSLKLGVSGQIWSGKRLGPLLGPLHDPESPTRSIGEPGMPEISRIADGVDDLQPLGLTSRPQFLLPTRPGVGPIFGTYVSLARTPRPLRPGSRRLTGVESSHPRLPAIRMPHGRHLLGPRPRRERIPRPPRIRSRPVTTDTQRDRSRSSAGSDCISIRNRPTAYVQ